jgi:hypothetical protein
MNPKVLQYSTHTIGRNSEISGDTFQTRGSLTPSPPSSAPADIDRQRQRSHVVRCSQQIVEVTLSDREDVRERRRVITGEERKLLDLWHLYTHYRSTRIGES